MKFTSACRSLKHRPLQRAWRLMALCAMAMLLNACSAITYKPAPAEERVAEESVGGEHATDKGIAGERAAGERASEKSEAQQNSDTLGGDTSSGPLQKTINPYLALAPEVPAAAQSRFDEAVGFLKQGNVSAAESRFLDLTRDYPSLSGPWLNLGLVYLRSDRREQAKTQFERAIAANKLNLNAHNQLAILFREEGEFAAAEQHYLQALKVWPDHVASLRNLGILYDVYMGRQIEALEYYQRAQALAPDRQMRGWIADLKRRSDRGEQ